MDTQRFRRIQQFCFSKWSIAPKFVPRSHCKVFHISLPPSLISEDQLLRLQAQGLLQATSFLAFQELRASVPVLMGLNHKPGGGVRLLHAKQKALSPRISADVHDVQGITKMQSSTQACTEDVTAAVSRDHGGKEERGASLARFHVWQSFLWVAYPAKHSVLFGSTTSSKPCLALFLLVSGCY